MNTVKVIKKLKNEKIFGQDTLNKQVISNANRAIHGVLNDRVKRAKMSIDIENKYRRYLLDNVETIKKNVSVDCNVNTIQEAIDVIKTIDFRIIFGIDIAFKENFLCDFCSKIDIISFFSATNEEKSIRQTEIIENYNGKNIYVNESMRFGKTVTEITIYNGQANAWIDFDKKSNTYLYCIGDSDSKIDDYYNIISLYEIFMHCDYWTAVTELSNLLNIKIGNIESVNSKYRSNLYVLDNDDELKNKYKNLFRLINKQIGTLRQLMYEGIESEFRQCYYKDKEVFSCSNSYLGAKIGKAKSTVNNAVNTFALLGLIEKIDLSREEISKGSKKNRNEISYFYIPLFNDEILNNAELIALKFKERRITISKFDYMLCVNEFGMDIANNIFKDKNIKK